MYVFILSHNWLWPGFTAGIIGTVLFAWLAHSSKHNPKWLNVVGDSVTFVFFVGFFIMLGETEVASEQHADYSRAADHYVDVAEDRDQSIQIDHIYKPRLKRNERQYARMSGNSLADPKLGSMRISQAQRFLKRKRQLKSEISFEKVEVKNDYSSQSKTPVRRARKRFNHDANLTYVRYTPYREHERRVVHRTLSR